MTGVQERILAVYEAFADVCDRYGLRYFAIGGTAIGAARHSGFIPWDDDLDVAMPVEDYLEFFRHCVPRLPAYVHVLGPDNCRHYGNVFSKLEDIRTTVIERSVAVAGYRERYSGAWIDVMPMGGVPQAFHGVVPYFSRARSLALNNGAKRSFPEGAGSRRLLALQAVKGWRYRRAPANYYSSRWLDLIASRSFDDAKMVGYTWHFVGGGWLGKRLGRGLFGEDFLRRPGDLALEDLVFPREWFAKVVSMPFEGAEMRMPVGWREYLTRQFGDYMRVPEPRERASHDCFVDLVTPVEEYRTGRAKIPQWFLEGRE